jgi:hypothetical protein
MVEETLAQPLAKSIARTVKEGRTRFMAALRRCLPGAYPHPPHRDVDT